jgi:hypothetical protein
MKAYLRTAVGLMKDFHQAWEIYKDRSRHKDRAEGGFGSLSDEDMDSLLDFAFERYYETNGLFGSVDRCLERIEQLRGRPESTTSRASSTSGSTRPRRSPTSTSSRRCAPG